MPDQLNPGDLALIVGAIGTPDLIGHQCQVIDLHQGIGPAACRGRVMDCMTAEPCAFIDINGAVWLWSLRYLMPLKGDAAEQSWRKREVCV